MIKRTPSRNSRSKGIKVTHVLQVCLLLGICFWLIYQVKHSHDKKKEFDEKDAQVSIKAPSADEVLRFVRKGLYPRVQGGRNEKRKEDEKEEKLGQERMNRDEENKHDQEQEEDEEETKHEGEHKGENKHEEEDREDENNHEEGEQEEETKDEEIEDEGRRGEDDDIDENDQEKMDGEDDREEDILEEEKEREEIDEEKESEAQGKEQVDHETSTEDEDHDGESHEAREEHYKADDASSAVTHDNPTINPEHEKVGLEKSNEDSESNGLGQENQSSENGAHGAQGEHYKADNASSAVTHDNPVISTESERVNSENSNTNLVTSDLVQENKSNENYAYNINGDHNNSTLHLEQGIMAEHVLPGNSKDAGVSLTNSIDESPENTTSLLNDLRVLGNKYLELRAEAGDNAQGGSTKISDLSQQNGTVTMSNSIQAQNTTVDGATIGKASNLKTAELEHVNSTDSDNSLSDAKSERFGKTEAVDTIGRESSNSSSSLVSGASDKTDKPEGEAKSDINAASSSIIKEVTGDALNDSSSTNNESSGRDENLESSAAVGTGAADTHDRIDPPNTSIGQDIDARMDLDMLPKDIVEGVNSRDAAAE